MSQKAGRGAGAWIGFCLRCSDVFLRIAFAARVLDQIDGSQCAGHVSRAYLCPDDIPQDLALWTSLKMEAAVNCAPAMFPACACASPMNRCAMLLKSVNITEDLRLSVALTS